MVSQEFIEALKKNLAISRNPRTRGNFLRKLLKAVHMK